jgi:AAA domain
VALPSDLPEGWDLADLKPAGLDIKGLLSSAKEAEETGLVGHLVSATELSVMNVPAREMIVDPFIPTSSINLLFAARGIGKTWVALSLAAALASGHDFLGFEVRKPRGVLYVDGEMPLAALKERVCAIGADRLDNFFILPSESLFRTSGPLNIHSKKDQARVDAMLNQIEVQLVIFDNLSSLRSGIDENDNSSLDVFLQWLLALRHKGYAILLIHHAGKGGDQRGASRLEDFLDTTIKLTAVQKDEAQVAGACFDWTFTKTRGDPPKPDRLRLSLTPADDGILFWKFGDAPERKPQYETLRAIHLGPDGDRTSLFEKQLDLAEHVGLRKGTISKHVKVLRQRAGVSRGDRSDGCRLGTPAATFPR